MLRIWVLLLLSSPLSFAAPPLNAQSISLHARPRSPQHHNEMDRILLFGHTRPEARLANDRGPVATSSFALGHAAPIEAASSEHELALHNSSTTPHQRFAKLFHQLAEPHRNLVNVSGLAKRLLTPSLCGLDPTFERQNVVNPRGMLIDSPASAAQVPNFSNGKFICLSQRLEARWQHRDPRIPPLSLPSSLESSHSTISAAYDAHHPGVSQHAEFR